MERTQEEFYLKKCLGLLEAQLGWGTSADWTNYDFEKLSAEIENKTRVLLSVTTLKRIWGKVKYPHAPTTTTLNTLAKFLDYADWRSFTQHHHAPVAAERPVPTGSAATVPDKPRHRWLKMLWAPGLLLSLVLTFIVLSNKKATPNPKLDIAAFQFKSDKMISEGVPNTVIFNYDASAAASDSVYIAQTWDVRRKIQVPKNKHEHSAIYYFPGFFRAKLLVGNTVVKTHDLHITTNGWLCLAQNEPVPIYFKKEEFLKNDRLEIDERVLKAYNIPLLPVPPKLRFFYETDLGDLKNDHFTFETTLKNAFDKGSNACQRVEVLIQCKTDIFIIPLAAKACVGDLYLTAAGMEVDSKQADLSKFGCDLNEWTTLKVVSQNKHTVFYVNGVEAYALTFPNAPTDIVGVQIRFNGPGAVKNTWFENGGNKIFLQ